MKRTAKPSQDPLIFPATVLIDQRERLPYAFDGINADARDGRRPLLVRTQQVYLPTGDYSLAGFEDRVAVERKSLEDCFSTLGQGRERFERELARLAAPPMEWAAVVVEAGWHTILNDPPPLSQLRPKTIFRSVIAWQQRWPQVHWWFIEGRRLAEITTLRVLERFWKEKQRGLNDGRN